MSTATAPRITLDSLVLDRGSHPSPEQGMCVLEAAAYFAGKPFSDHPPCVSPIIGAFLRSWNDALNDTDRQRLKPYVPKILDTNTGPKDEDRRAWLIVDWLTRTFAPAWLERAGLDQHAVALRALPEMSSSQLATEAQATIEAARSAAAAAWAAARAAAGAAAWAALQPTVEKLQQSAFDLLDRLIAVGKVEVAA